MGIFSGVKAAGKVAAKSVDDAVGNKAVPTKVVDDVDGNTVYNDGLTPYVPPAKEYNDGLTPYTPPQAKEYNDGLTPYVHDRVGDPVDNSQMTFSELLQEASWSHSSDPEVQELVKLASGAHLSRDLVSLYDSFIAETDLSERDIRALLLQNIPNMGKGKVEALQRLEEVYEDKVMERLFPDGGDIGLDKDETLRTFFASPTTYPEEVAITSSQTAKSKQPLQFANDETEEAARELGMDTAVFHATREDFTQFKQHRATGLWDTLGAHVGTARAAEDRAGALMSVSGDAKSVRTLPLVLNRGNELRSEHGLIFTEVSLLRYLERMSKHLPQNKVPGKPLREFLLKKGYDTIPYYNDVEDIGSVSYIILNPSKVRDRAAKFSKKHAVKSGLTLSAGGFLVKEGLEEEEAKVE